jgi:GDPmannose 4,6-dehydratase
MLAKALITGIRGQDGRLLAQYLYKLGYEVHGLTRQYTQSLPPELKGVTIHQLDFSLESNPKSNPFDAIIADIRPDQVYHLAAANTSSETNSSLSNLSLYRANILYPIQLANSLIKHSDSCRAFWAGSVHQFTLPTANDQLINEATHAQPRNFYGWTKQVIREYVQEQARQEALWSSFGILFNHESHLRPSDFLLAKICKYAARVSLGISSGTREVEFLTLKSVLARVDWCSAHDVIRGMHLSLIGDHPGEFVFGSGKAVMVLDIVKIVSDVSGLDLLPLIKIEDPDYSANAIVNNKIPALIADTERSKTSLGWTPSVSLEEMIAEIYEFYQLRLKKI